ncbi:MAG TPA: class I SAM-dependent methyltransferase, partial [Bacillales bacterium]|nr:class I SAM-dependent methyltransferase [Bacillales bacterium]
EVHDHLKEQTGSWHGKSVLDVGCGPGRILMRGLGEAAALTGVDLSPEMIKAARRNLGGAASLVTGDAYDLPFAENTFDIALSTCVLFLLPEPEKGISEMIRVTNDGGVVAMLNPSRQMDPEHAEQYCSKHGIEGFERETLVKWSNVSTRRHRYGSDQLTGILTESGAEMVTHEEVLDGLAIITVAGL